MINAINVGIVIMSQRGIANVRLAALAFGVSLRFGSSEGGLAAFGTDRDGEPAPKEILNGCWHLGHLARLPSLSRETLNDAPQLGQTVGAFMVFFSSSGITAAITEPERKSCKQKQAHASPASCASHCYPRPSDLAGCDLARFGLPEQCTIVIRRRRAARPRLRRAPGRPDSLMHPRDRASEEPDDSPLRSGSTKGAAPPVFAIAPFSSAGAERSDGEDERG